MKYEEQLTQLTLAEKASMLAGADMWRTVAINRLGIPSVQVSDGPSGVRGADDNLESTSICMPAGVALGATWNPELASRVGGDLAREARERGVAVLLAPTVNIHRTPLAGRNFECYAEDPYLSGSIASGYIAGLQRGGVGACIKHFVANDQEFERFTISSEVAERPLHEIYLEPFRIAVERAQPWTLMSAYNRINGTYASEHQLLVGELLKGDWGFDGVVISDWYGTYNDRVPFGPLDLEMPGPARYMNPDAIVAAVEAGDLSEAHIDDKVRRLLRLIDRVTEGQAAANSAPADHDGATQAAALQAATESIVLLKNQDGLLPLATSASTIVVIGENAERPQIAGGGSAFVNPHYVVSPLEGIRARAGDTAQVTYQIGTPIHRTPPLIDPAWLAADDGSTGLDLTYYPNRTLSGDASQTAVVSRTELSWFGTVNPYVDPRNFSLRLSGTITAPDTGTYTLHLTAMGKVRLLVGDNTLVDTWSDGVHTDKGVAVDLVAGEPMALLVEYASDPDSTWRTVRLGCSRVLPYDPIDAAVEAARASDVAVVVAGYTREWESEGFDRSDLNLVGRQDELIERVAAANPRTIVVLNTGSPVAMPWVDDVAAVLQSWYGGQDAGSALAAILFGDQSPSGRLPTTYPRALEETPAYLTFPGENGRVHYGEQIFVGYRYYDKRDIEPLFPFGHGLSYTTFDYRDIRVNGDTFAPGDPIIVDVDVANIGERAAAEVVQLYVSDVESRLARPVRELKAFAKVSLQPGEQATVRLELSARSLAYYDTACGGWVTEPGDFELHVGRSSRDVRLTTRITWHDDTYVAPQANLDGTQPSTVAT